MFYRRSEVVGFARIPRPMTKRIRANPTTTYSSGNYEIRILVDLPCPCLIVSSVDYTIVVTFRGQILGQSQIYHRSVRVTDMNYRPEYHGYALI